MQVVKVELQDGVFVPLEPVNVGEDYEAVVVIGEKRVQETEKVASNSRDKARRFFTENFPDLEINEDILELVGILRGHPEGHGKEEYYEYLGKKYR